jgi:hypothetical protein
MKKIKMTPKIYCHTCGEPLIREKIYANYDRNTGLRRFFLREKCKNKKWWNLHPTVFTGYSY